MGTIRALLPSRSFKSTPHHGNTPSSYSLPLSHGSSTRPTPNSFLDTPRCLVYDTSDHVHFYSSGPSPCSSDPPQSSLQTNFGRALSTLGTLPPRYPYGVCERLFGVTFCSWQTPFTVVNMRQLKLLGIVCESPVKLS